MPLEDKLLKNTTPVASVKNREVATATARRLLKAEACE
jgi:hypothetical protein